jgi:hypothetical protein
MAQPLMVAATVKRIKIIGGHVSDSIAFRLTEPHLTAGD